MEIEEIKRIIEAEPELPGPMPERLWKRIERAVGDFDKEYVERAFRLAVRKTKQNIINRLEAIECLLDKKG